MKKLSSLLILLFLFSCAQVVKVADNREANQKHLTSIEQGLTVITSDLTTLNAAIEKSNDTQAKNKLAKLTFSQRNLIQNYTRTKEDFESSKFKERTTIKEKNGDFEAAKKEQAEMDSRFVLLENQLKTYRQDRNALKDYLETKGIYRVDAKVLNRDFIQALNDSKRIQLGVKNELMDYNVRLNNSTDPEEKKKQHKLVIQELVKIVERMENVTFRLQRVHVATVAEVGAGVKYVTPGMRAHNYPAKIKVMTDLVAVEDKNFHELAKQLEN